MIRRPSMICFLAMAKRSCQGEHSTLTAGSLRFSWIGTDGFLHLLTGFWPAGLLKPRVDATCDYVPLDMSFCVNTRTYRISGHKENFGKEMNRINNLLAITKHVVFIS